MLRISEDRPGEKMKTTKSQRAGNPSMLMLMGLL
jgi:hypothetical protein